jgi:hypothetical protein
MDISINCILQQIPALETRAKVTPKAGNRFAVKANGCVYVLTTTAGLNTIVDLIELDIRQAASDF